MTDGGWNAGQIAITELAKNMLIPVKEGMELDSRKNALLQPRIIREFLEKYNGSPLPRNDIARNVLEEMGVPRDRTEDVYEMIVNGARYAGMIAEAKGKMYVDIGGDNPVVPNSTDEDAPSDLGVRRDSEPPLPESNFNLGTSEDYNDSEAHRRKRVFLSHGKDRGLLDPIKKLLSFGELDAVISIDSSTVSIPMPDKVMSDMRSCGAAIIHIRSEDPLINKMGKEVVSINPNVLIEIGAAMALYGKRFILLVKEGVQLPSNLQGLSEVRYSGDSLDMKETVNLLEAIGDIKNHPLPS